MAYQDVKRALTRLSHPGGEHMDQEHQWRCFHQIYEAYNQLAQEVRLCHNMIQTGSTSVTAGATTVTVTLPAPMPNAVYSVSALVSTLNAWVAYPRLTDASRTVTSFGLTFSAAAPVGNGSVIWIVVG